MFEKFDIDEKHIYKVCVVATMSAGKSTFINSIIGDEIMPEKNEACTARTMAVLDNDSVRVKKAHIIRKNGSKEVIEIDSRDVLTRVNQDEDINDFLVETNIPSIANTKRALMLVDTPGVNNSADARHGERTEAFLKQMDMGLIIYLLNATQLATNDDAVLLSFVSEHIKRQEGTVKIIFVINKIDALDLETESIAETVRLAKEYIEAHGIKNPVIYPLSALAAKTMRMALYRKEMTRRELRKLEDIYENYRPKDNDMLTYAVLDDMAGETYEIGDETASAQELQRAIDNTGITAIEKRMESLMLDIENHYAPEIVIKSQLSKSAAQSFQDRLLALSKYTGSFEQKKFEDIKNKVRKSAALQKANEELCGIEAVSAVIDLTETLPSASCELAALIGNFELSKKTLDESFFRNECVCVKRLPGFFFGPEKELSAQISMKCLYLMSEDGKTWVSVQFGQAARWIARGTDFYLCNEYAPFLFRVTNGNAADIIALLDIKIPVSIIKIAGIRNTSGSLEEINRYIEQVEMEAAAERARMQAAEEQLRRTYKGIVCASEQEKDRMIEIEKQMQEYCQTLEGKELEELWAMKEQLAKLPNAIFAPYISTLLSGMENRENVEKNQYLARIEGIELHDLRGVLREIEAHHYTETTKQVLKAACNRRKLICQRQMLEALMIPIDNLDREGLKLLISEIKSREYDPQLTDEFIARVRNQNDLLEAKELRALCADLEQKEIPQLKELEKQIMKGGYQEKFYAQYISMIHSRIDFLHVKNMERVCSKVSAADRETLNLMKEAVLREDCRYELKSEFFALIDQRSETLDYEELCLLTDGLENKTPDELEKLYQKLKTDAYNQKFIKAFLFKVRIRLECAQENDVHQLISGLSGMQKDQVLLAREQIEKLGYPDRVVQLAKQKIEERIYVLDLIELIAEENNFDHLSRSDIEALKRKIKQKDVSERSRITYSKKLRERERILSYQLISRNVCYAKQMAEQYDLGELKIVFAIFSSEYEKLLEKHYAQGGAKGQDDIPIFFIPECADLAITKREIYCRTNAGYATQKNTEVQSFSIGKKLFSNVLTITFRNGLTETLPGGIHKRYVQTLPAFLNMIVQNLNNEAVLSNYKPYFASVAGLTARDFEVKQLPAALTREYVVEIFRNRMDEIAAKVKLPSLKYCGTENWDALEKKVIARFDFTRETSLVLYYDSTLLNSAKEGFAFGLQNLVLKNHGKDAVVISYSEIYEVSRIGQRIAVTTIHNQVYMSDPTILSEQACEQIGDALDAYVKGMQLLTARNAAAQPDAGASKTGVNGAMTKEGNICPNCGKVMDPDHRFCARCGTRLDASTT